MGGSVSQSVSQSVIDSFKFGDIYCISELCELDLMITSQVPAQNRVTPAAEGKRQQRGADRWDQVVSGGKTRTESKIQPESSGAGVLQKPSHCRRVPVKVSVDVKLFFNVKLNGSGDDTEHWGTLAVGWWSGLGRGKAAHRLTHVAVLLRLTAMIWGPNIWTWINVRRRKNKGSITMQWWYKNNGGNDKERGTPGTRSGLQGGLQEVSTTLG